MRIRKNSDFSRIYHRGKSVANKYLVLYYLKNGIGSPRIGVSVSKKVGNSVVRHRVKRLIKEVFRLHFAPGIDGVDFVFVARNVTADASYCDIKSSMENLFHRMEKRWKC